MDVAALLHVGFEDLGVWAELLDGRGAKITYLQAGVDSLAPLAEADLAVVMGGPIAVYDAAYPVMTDEVAAVRSRLERDAPTLGVCLGAQVIAAALGARVHPGKHELGWAPVALTDDGVGSELAPLDGVDVLHWHGDTFDLPAGAQLLAWTAATPHQAFRAGRALAVQFHPEVDPALIERWLIGHAHELAARGHDVGALRADSARLGERAVQAGRQVLDGFLDRVL